MNLKMEQTEDWAKVQAEPRTALLLASLETSVRMRLLKGDVPTFESLSLDRAELERLTDMIASKGDTIMFRSEKVETAKAFNALAEAIAILASHPGGVEFLGHRWTAEP